MKFNNVFSKVINSEKPEIEEISKGSKALSISSTKLKKLHSKSKIYNPWDVKSSNSEEKHDENYYNFDTDDMISYKFSLINNGHIKFPKTQLKQLDNVSTNIILIKSVHTLESNLNF